MTRAIIGNSTIVIGMGLNVMQGDGIRSPLVMVIGLIFMVGGIVFLAKTENLPEWDLDLRDGDNQIDWPVEPVERVIRNNAECPARERYNESES